MESRVWEVAPVLSEWRRGFFRRKRWERFCSPVTSGSGTCSTADFGLRHALGLAAITGTLGSLGGYLVSEIVLEPFVSDEARRGPCRNGIPAWALSVTALARARAISAGAYSSSLPPDGRGCCGCSGVRRLLHSIKVAAAVALVAATTVQATVSFRARRRVGMKIGLLIETSREGLRSRRLSRRADG